MSIEVRPRDAARFADGMRRVSEHLGGIAYGADYNPEQWPREVWREDVELMREAGVNLVSLGIFSWALLEPEEGRYDWSWLDEVVALLHEAGIAIDLANATASPPPWFSLRYPDSRPVTESGVRLEVGSRQAYCPTSPEFRAASARLTSAIVERYGDHPAVIMWHVSNEYGCHDIPCFCARCGVRFREWLQAKYGTLDALNEAWGTAFWSQHYWQWDEIQPPRLAPSFRNPSQRLDWARATSDFVLECFLSDAAAIRASSDKPLTTNFMGHGMDVERPIDYWRWAGEQDLISNDHYLIAEDVDNARDLALVADLTRGWALGAPWLLMEHSTSAVNWQSRNVAKAQGELIRNSVQHVARGADGALFFQWRQSRAGAEKYHSALVPHAGRDSKVWREVVELGGLLGALSDVTGSTVDGVQVALLFDTDARWSAELEALPSVDARPADELRRWYDALHRAGVAVDVRTPGDDLSGYRLVIAPMLHLVSAATAAELQAYVERGGTFVATYFSGTVDERDHIVLGGYPGALRDLLGVRIEEFVPLREGEGTPLSTPAFGAGRVWSELGRVTDADARAVFTEGTAAGSPAVTRAVRGEGSAWYVATSLAPEGLDALVGELLADADVEVVEGAGGDVEVIDRAKGAHRWRFVINHGEAVARVAASGTRLDPGAAVDGAAVDGTVVVAPGGVAVVRLDAE